MRKIYFYLLGSFIFSINVFLTADNQTNFTGLYSSIDIAVNSEAGELTGYFDERVGWDKQTKSPRFSCTFYIYGKKVKDHYKIWSWYPGDEDQTIKGVMTFFIKNGIEFVKMKLEEEPGGCGMAYPLNTKEGDIFEILEKGNYREIRVIKKKRAYFYKDPDTVSRLKAYLIKDDVIRVLKFNKNSVYTEFGKTKGWIKISDIFPKYPEPGTH